MGRAIVNIIECRDRPGFYLSLDGITDDPLGALIFETIAEGEQYLDDKILSPALYKVIEFNLDQQ